MMKLWRSYQGMAVQAKASVWYTFCNFLQRGIAVIVVPIYTRILTTAEYGTWGVFQSWTEILLIFASLNLYCGVYTKTLVDMKEEKEKDRYTSSMLGLGTLATICMLGLYLLLRGPADRLLGYDPTTMALLFLYFAVYPALSFWSTRQYTEYKYKKLVAVTLLLSVLSPAVSVFLLYNTDLRAVAIIRGFLLVQNGFGLFFYVYQLIRGRVLVHRGYWKYALKFNIPLIPHYLSLIVLGQSDRIMIKHYCGESDAGIYALAYQVASAMTVLAGAVNGSRVPWTYAQLRDRVYTSLRKVSSLLCLMMAAVTFCVVMFTPEIVSIFGTAEYGSAVYVVPVVALGIYFTFVYDLFCGVEFYYGATQYVMYASVIGAVLNIILNALLIPVMGFIAAGYTTLFCYFVFMMMHLVFMKKVCREQKITEPVYDLKTIFGISGAAAAVTLAGMLLYPYHWVRYGILVLLLAVGFIKRNDIKALLTHMKEREGSAS